MCIIRVGYQNFNTRFNRQETTGIIQKIVLNTLYTIKIPHQTFCMKTKRNLSVVRNRDTDKADLVIIMVKNHKHEYIFLLKTKVLEQLQSHTK